MGPPPPALMQAIAAIGGEATQAGVLVDTGGLLPTAAGALVRVSGGKITVTDGPFAEGKEVIGGYAAYEVASKEEAIRWSTTLHGIARRALARMGRRNGDPASDGAAESSAERQERSPLTNTPFRDAAATSVRDANSVPERIVRNLTEMQEQKMENQVQSAGGRSRTYWLGWVMSGLVVAFLLMDSTMKLMALPIVIETSGPLGFPGADMARGLGIVLLVCTLLYVAPQSCRARRDIADRLPGRRSSDARARRKPTLHARIVRRVSRRDALGRALSAGRQASHAHSHT